jgi:hypothetical protein
MARIADPRAIQFWDKDHLVATELRQQFPSSQSLCCQRNGILWTWPRCTRRMLCGAVRHLCSSMARFWMWRVLFVSTYIGHEQ